MGQARTINLAGRLRVNKEDPIVAEVGKHRQKRAAKFKHDIGAMIEDARKREGTSGHPVVSPPRRRRAKVK
jgi:hypothetical protein